MASQTPLDWLTYFFAKFYQSITVGGVQQTQETALDIEAGSGIIVTGSDVPGTGTTLVTIAATGATSTIAIAAAASLTAANMLSEIAADTTNGSFTITLPAITVDGQEFRCHDPALNGDAPDSVGQGGSWGTNPLTVKALGSAVIENPVAPAAYIAGATGVTLNQSGAAITYRANLALNSWKKK
jgi:hypothetical protein